MKSGLLLSDRFHIAHTCSTHEFYRLRVFQDDPLTPIHKFCFFVFDFFTHFPENSEILGHSYGFSSFTEGLERVTTLQPEVGWYQNRLSRESR